MIFIKKYAVWIGLLLTLALVFFTQQQQEEVVDAVPVNTEKTTVVSRQPHAALSMAANDIELRQKIIQSPRNLFAVPETSKAELARQRRPVRPVVPANPFHYAGKLVEQGQMTIFLTDGRKNYAVKAGDIVEETWKVESISANEMTLLNLPTQTQVNVQIGALL